MNFSALSSSGFVGKLLRLPLRFIPPTARMRVLQGRLRGKLWIAGASDHGCWLGSFEYDKQKLFEHEIRPGSVVYDIGANVGFYALLASELVGTEGTVIAFEPVPSNVRYIESHLALNNVSNVRILQAAVADKSGTACFKEASNNSMGHLDSVGDYAVEVVTIDGLLAAGKVSPPQYIKMDIEGAEALALRGAEGCFRRYKPVLFLATHGCEVHEQCMAQLRAWGYVTSLIGNESDEIFAKPAE